MSETVGWLHPEQQVFATDRKEVKNLVHILRDCTKMDTYTYVVRREGMVRGVEVLEVYAKDCETWPADARVLWHFLLSLSGRGVVDLEGFAYYWHGSIAGQACVSVLRSMMSVED